MVNLDLSNYIKKKPTFYKDASGKSKKLPEDKWLDYLEWANVIVLLYQNGAEDVSYGSEKNENGYPSFFNPKGECPFVRVWVKIDDKKYEIDYPVISGSSVKANPLQSTIHVAQQRAFVKCVAINTGLGLSCWLKDEENSAAPEAEKEVSDKKKHSQELVSAFSKLVKRSGSADGAHVLLGTNKLMLQKLCNSSDNQSKISRVEEIGKWLSLDNESFAKEVSIIKSK